ncbi:MAG TPA: DUF5691 domain-containing protein [Agitococcus sp.]|nr:DUF5691 domain-containing protein [Agitococcus sp.]
MSAWQQLQVAALLGTQKNSPSPQWPTELAPLMSQFSENSLLNQLAALSAYQRCAFSAITMANPTPSSPETLAASTRQQQKWLSYLLSYDGLDYLLDWLNLASKKQVAFPAAQLPELLDIGYKHKKLRLAICQVAGQRGAWLAERNTDWQWLQGGQISLENEQLSDYWHTASAASRELLFERLRLANPAQARDFLQQVWREEAATTRKLLLEKFSANLSVEDHDFLESCLDDRSRVVNEQTVELLASLQGSLLQQRLQHTLSQHLTLKKGLIHKSLQIEAIEQVTDVLERDGLNPKAADIKNGLGEKAQWLRDVIAGVSLDWLSHHYELQAEAFIHAALKTDWAEALLIGLSTAAIRQKHNVWLKALLDVDSKKLALPRFRLFDALSISDKESWLLAHAGQSKKELERGSVFIQFFYQSQPWLWTHYFTIAVMDVYQQQLKLQQSNNQLGHYLARYGDAQLAQKANQYPTQIINTWLMRMEIEQAFS